MTDQEITKDITPPKRKRTRKVSTGKTAVISKWHTVDLVVRVVCACVLVTILAGLLLAYGKPLGVTEIVALSVAAAALVGLGIRNGTGSGIGGALLLIVCTMLMSACSGQQISTRCSTAIMNASMQMASDCAPAMAEAAQETSADVEAVALGCMPAIIRAASMMAVGCMPDTSDPTCSEVEE